MKTKSITRGRPAKGGPFSYLLSAALILSLALPAWAVVFTNGAGIVINDATAIGSGKPYPANVTVSGMSGTVTDVSVTFTNVNHTFPDDFDILLVGPAGGNLILVSDTGGSDDITNTTITLSDAAAASLPDATKLINGTYKPTNIGAGDTFNAPAPAPSANTTFAAAFGGTNPNGVWSLYVADDLGVDMGVIGNGWSLTVTTTGTAPTGFGNTNAISGGDGARGRGTPYASTIVASGLTGAITDINVTLTNLDHLNPDDIDIVLVGPSGKRIVLMSDAGGTTDAAFAILTFDDQATNLIPDAGPVVTATVKPSNYGTGDTLPDLLAPYPNSGSAGGATLASVFGGTQPNGTWELYVIDDATTSAGTIFNGWSIDITAGGTFGAKRFTAGDLNGDGKTEVGIYRPSDSNWWTRDSSSYANAAFKWGTANDVPVPGDYNGDGKQDISVFRPSTGTWFTFLSGVGTFTSTNWGLGTDLPVPADYDGDGKSDISIYRASEGNWYVLRSATGAARVVKWGNATDRPVLGHFEGTNGADFAVFRPSEANWYILSNGGSTFRIVHWGLATDKPVPADYDGDGKTDVAVFRPSAGDWYVLESSSGGFAQQHWGQNGDIAVPGDYDGDSMADLAIFRPVENNWHIANSGAPFTAGVIRSDNWGTTGDIVIPGMYIPAQ